MRAVRVPDSLSLSPLVDGDEGMVAVEGETRGPRVRRRRASVLGRKVLVSRETGMRGESVRKASGDRGVEVCAMKTRVARGAPGRICIGSMPKDWSVFCVENRV